MEQVEAKKNQKYIFCFPLVDVFLLLAQALRWC